MRKESSRKADEVYARLKKQIVMSELLPGQQLVELELAGTLGCSQSTVREALLRLQEDGLIVRQGYRGTSVSSITPTESQIFLELRTMLETQAARLSLKRIDESALTALRHIVEEIEAAATNEDPYAVFEKDLAFHMRVFEIADLPALVPVLMRCSMYNHRNKISQTDKPRALTETARRHRKIVEALAAGNADVVEEVVRHHVVSVFGTPEPDAAPRRAEDLMSESMREVFAYIAADEAGFADPVTLPPADGRKQFVARSRKWNQIDARRFAIERFVIPANPLARTEGRDVPAVRVKTAGSQPAASVLYLHGGGWTFGSPETHLGTMSRIADLSGCEVVGIDYALAPEAPFPAGLNECTWSWRWLQAQENSHNTQRPWFLAGDSSGANLALAMMLDLRQIGEALPDAAAFINGAFIEESNSESHRLFGGGDFGLSTARMAWFWNNYHAAGYPEFARTRMFPTEADLNGLPPLLVIAAGLDPLRDDSVKLVKTLAGTSTPFEFRQHAGVIHGFIQMYDRLPEARQAIGEVAAFFRARIA